jgi:hypothetical protein
MRTDIIFGSELKKDVVIRHLLLTLASSEPRKKEGLLKLPASPFRMASK